MDDSNCDTETITTFDDAKDENGMSAFEKYIATETRRRGCDGVICGHINKAEMKNVEDILYANDGDWVESMTALV